MKTLAALLVMVSAGLAGCVRVNARPPEQVAVFGRTVYRAEPAGEIPPAKGDSLDELRRENSQLRQRADWLRQENEKLDSKLRKVQAEIEVLQEEIRLLQERLATKAQRI